MSIHMLVHLGVSDLSHDFSAHTSEDTQSAGERVGPLVL